MESENRIKIICGHYGCGKTNLTLNLAMEAAENSERVTVVDMDIVNPYFRSSEYGELLGEKGIRLIAPVFANTTLDTPTLPPDIYSIFEPESGTVFIDAGGDDAGVTALGGLHNQLEESGYDMLYVINQNRVLSQTPEDCIELLKEIEAAARLKATGVINNTHLGEETDLETLLEGLPFANKTADLLNLPLLYSTAPDFALAEDERLPTTFKQIKRYVKPVW